MYVYGFIIILYLKIDILLIFSREYRKEYYSNNNRLKKPFPFPDRKPDSFGFVYG